MFIDSGKITSTWGKEPPVMTTREELKTKAARKEWEKIVTQVGEERRRIKNED